MTDDKAAVARRRLYGEYGNAEDGPRDDPPYDHAAVTKESLLRTLALGRSVWKYPGERYLTRKEKP